MELKWLWAPAPAPKNKGHSGQLNLDTNWTHLSGLCSNRRSFDMYDRWPCSEQLSKIYCEADCLGMKARLVSYEHRVSHATASTRSALGTWFWMEAVLTIFTVPWLIIRWLLIFSLLHSAWCCLMLPDTVVRLLESTPNLALLCLMNRTDNDPPDTNDI